MSSAKLRSGSRLTVLLVYSLIFHFDLVSILPIN